MITFVKSDKQSMPTRMWGKLFLVLIIFYQNNQTAADTDYEAYCKLDCEGKKNTMCVRKDEKCGPVKNCKVEPLTKDSRQILIDVHNELRNNLALGKEPLHPKKISNMMVINYDMILEEMAGCHANTCIRRPEQGDIHDKCRRVEKWEFVGQNIISYFDNYDIRADWIGDNITYWGPRRDWYQNEIIGVDDVNYGPDGFQDKLKPSFQGKIGHYTQLVWGDTEYIGCARTTSDAANADSDNVEDWYAYSLVCNYGPMGNLLKGSMFLEGEPCSKCPAGVSCNDKYKGLCGLLEDVPGTASRVSISFHLLNALIVIYYYM